MLVVVWGTGTLAFFQSAGFELEHLGGIDLVDDRIEQARVRLPAARLFVANAADIPFADRSFDVTLQTTMLSSITNPDVRTLVAAEMVRVTRSGGVLISWDIRKAGTRNPHLVSIDEAETRRLFGAAGQLEMFQSGISLRIASRVGPRLAAVLEHFPVNFG